MKKKIRKKEGNNMMGSIPQTGKKRTYVFEYDYHNAQGKWETRTREFDSKGKAETAHAIIALRKDRSPSKYKKLTQIVWRDTWKLPEGSKRR